MGGGGGGGGPQELDVQPIRSLNPQPLLQQAPLSISANEQSLIPSFLQCCSASTKVLTLTHPGLLHLRFLPNSPLQQFTGTLSSCSLARHVSTCCWLSFLPLTHPSAARYCPATNDASKVAEACTSSAHTSLSDFFVCLSRFRYLEGAM